MTNALLVYLLVGWVLACVAYFGAGQHQPEDKRAPKWLTVGLIVFFWPIIVISIVRKP